MAGLTFDTGALLAIERRRDRMLRVIRAARIDGARVTIPAAVVAEWWRARTDVREAMLAAFDVEPLDAALSRVAGEALAAVASATTIDAIVMASAARRGDVVYTSDFADLERLRTYFPSVRVLTV